ncbi:hypothetical protein [Chromobacterium haemolyticum]|uniref:hypothetical protein n=1 Tax=Chromobacterium haemolyticum TaxID=394935 RepID=UPI0011B1C8E2|nr:hypothetical protein [Chromobacterium haemolyticum]
MSLRDEYIKAGVIKPATPNALEPKEELPAKPNAKQKQSTKKKEKMVYSTPKPNGLWKKVMAHAEARKAKPKGTTCILCGEFIQPGKLLAHKVEVHDEKMFSTSPPHVMELPTVVFISGGSPGSKKR